MIEHAGATILWLTVALIICIVLELTVATLIRIITSQTEDDTDDADRTNEDPPNVEG